MYTYTSTNMPIAIDSHYLIPSICLLIDPEDRTQDSISTTTNTRHAHYVRLRTREKNVLLVQYTTYELTVRVTKHDEQSLSMQPLHFHSVIQRFLFGEQVCRTTQRNAVSIHFTFNNRCAACDKRNVHFQQSNHKVLILPGT